METPRWALPLLEDARFKVAHGGRGGGKSTFFAGLLVEEHIMNPNQRSICVRAVQNSIEQSVKQLIEEVIYSAGLSDHFEILNTEIKNKKGTGVMVFKGLQNYNSANIKSFQGFDRAWIEEAVDLSQKGWDDLEPTIRKAGSQIWVSFNPRYKTDPVDALFRSEAPPEDSIIVNVNIHDNPWATEANIKSMEYDRGRDIDKYNHVWLGGYLTNSESRVFKNWKVEDFEAPEDAVFRFGADFGFAKDPTVLIRCYIIGRKLYIDYEAHAIELEIVDTPELFLSIPESERYPMTADSSRPETISHLRKHGFPKILGAVKGKNSIEEGIEWLKSFDIMVHPRCVHTIDELTHYSYKTDPLTDNVLPVFEDKNNHVIDALRYACEGARRLSAVQDEPVEIEDLSVTPMFN